MSEEEKYFAFILNEGIIELVYWCKTEAEARKKVAEWKRKDKQYHDEHSSVHYFVGQILFEPKQEKAVSVEEAEEP